MLTPSTSILQRLQTMTIFLGLFGVRDFGPKLIKEQANGCNATPMIAN